MNMRKTLHQQSLHPFGNASAGEVGAVCTAVYLLTQNITAVRCVFLFSLFVLLCVIFFVALIRRKLVRFSDAFWVRWMIYSPGTIWPEADGRGRKPVL